MVELTQEIVKELLDYDPETGVLTWRERGDKWFEDGRGRYSTSRRSKAWNKRLAGKPAFTYSATNGYKQGGLFGKLFLAHRVIWLYMTGEWPKEQIDHKNGVRDDNRWSNLKSVSPLQNGRNQGRRKNNTSGYKGVSWDKQNQKWKANIVILGKTTHIGLFNTPEEAHRAYVITAKAVGCTNRHIFGAEI